MTWAQKTCAGCRIVKPPEAFRPHPKLSSGLSSRCRDCMRADLLAWREAHREQIESRNAERRAGPFANVCSSCGVEFEAKCRPAQQPRCPNCQREHRKTRDRARVRTRA